MKEVATAFGIGAVNLTCAAITYQGIITSFTLIANALVALISLGFGAYKIVRIVVNHFKERHKEDCTCEQDIKDIIDRQ